MTDRFCETGLSREPGDMYFSWDGSEYTEMLPVVQITGLLRETMKNVTRDNSTRILVRVVDNGT